MISANTTYILGAGASCKSQPLVVDMKQRMECLLDLLNPNCEFHQTHIIPEFKNKTGFLYDKYMSIVHEAVIHYTPDTYARKLWLNSKKEDLDLFKEFLNLYFLFEQDETKDTYISLDNIAPSNEVITKADVKIMFEGAKFIKQKYFSDIWTKIIEYKDYRYDVFLATLLQTDMSRDVFKKHLFLPKEINIFTWNYDNQFEIAYKEYCIDCNNETINKNLNINNKYTESQSHILKINGLCNLFTTGEGGSINNFRTSLENLISGTKTQEPMLHFAWEDNMKEHYLTIDKIMETTNELVIIGYSFPNFNRDYDKIILDKLSPTNCPKIIIQVPFESEFKKIRDNFQRLNTLYKDNNFIHEDNPDQFYIP